jgi:hypothetical protein
MVPTPTLPSWVARILQAILGAAERARVHELVVMVLVRVMTFRFILRRQLNRNRQCGEQSQSDDARQCFGIHIFLLVVFSRAAAKAWNVFMLSNAA